MSEHADGLTTFERVRVAVITLLAVVVGIWGIHDTLPELYRGLTTTPFVCSVSALAKVDENIEAQVTGVIDTERILVETSNHRSTGENLYTHYYYPFYDQQRTAGIYVYSELAPAVFLARYGQGEVTLHGVFEPIPKALRIQEPMSRQFEQMTYLQAHAPNRNVDTLIQALADFHGQAPLVTGRRLNLHPVRHQFSQSFQLLTSTAFLVFGVAALWSLRKKR